MTKETEEQVSEGEMLTQLALLAGQGTRAFVLVGKIKNARRSKPKNDNEPGAIYAGIICGEGETLEVSLDPKGTVPHGEQNGAFLLSPQYYQGQLSRFTVSNYVLA